MVLLSRVKRSRAWSSVRSPRQTFFPTTFPSNKEGDILDLRKICFHYNRGKVYIRHVLTHAEYDRERWKGD